MDSHSVAGELADYVPVPRAKRTYGRKKDAPPQAETGPGPNHASSSKQPFSNGETTLLDDLFSAVKSAGSLDEAHDFGWKARLKEIDDEYDDEEDGPRTREGDGAVHGEKSGSSQQSPSREDDSFTTTETMFEGSLSTLTSSSQTEPSSPMPQTFKNRSSKRAVLDSDDEERDTTKSPSQSSPGSSRCLRLARPSKDKLSLSPPSSGGRIKSQLLPSLKLTRPSASPTDELGGQSGVRLSRAAKKRISSLKEKVPNIKKLNKKEEKESRKAHMRMIADQEISVNKSSELFTINQLFAKIKQPDGRSLSPSKPLKKHPSSEDSINDFTSSPPLRASTGSLEPTLFEKQPGLLNSVGNDSDEDMPDVQEILNENKDRHAEAQRKKYLKEAKLRLIQQRSKSSAQAQESDADEDDLEFVDNNKSSLGGQPKTLAKHDLEVKLRNIGGFQGGRNFLQSPIGGSQDTQILKRAAQPQFGGRKSRRNTSSAIAHQDLTEMIRKKANKQGQAIIKEKQDEWVRRGGKLKGEERAVEEGQSMLASVVERLAQRTVKISAQGSDGALDKNVSDDDDDDESDGDWEPTDRGSVSPAGSAGAPSRMKDEFDEEEVVAEGETTLVDPEFEDTEDEHFAPARHAIAHRAGRMVVSDSDDENQTSFRPGGRVLVPDTSMVLDSPSIQAQALAHRGSLSSLDEPSPDENEIDKENNQSLIFGHGEDKENLAVLIPSNSQMGQDLSNSQNRSISALAEGMRRGLSMSPSASGRFNANPASRKRRPLQQRDLGDLDDEFPPTSSVTNIDGGSPGFAQSLGSGSPKPLQAAFGGGLGGFTQLFHDEDGDDVTDENAPPPKAFLAPAFSLANSFSEESKQVATTSGGISNERPFAFNQLRRDDAEGLSLTLDTNFQPALEVESQVLRRADAIFDKEQEILLDEAMRKPQAKPVLYVTENGLLTQTRPDVSSPVVYRAWSPTQNTFLTGSEVMPPPTATTRQPLSTLSFTTSETLSPTQPQQLSRLRKGARESSEAEGSILGDPFSESRARDPDVRKNAFMELLKPKGPMKQRTEPKLLHKSDFVEGEAAESDEDEHFGFGAKKTQNEDEDSEDEDPDAVIKNLVDDEKMDADTEAVDKVLEKVKEHQDMDDQELEKYHMRAVEGKMRGKRRGGRVGLDDSESEDEDEEARRLRQKMHKKRRVEGDTLEDLAKDEKSRAFVDAYEKDVHDPDNNDFDYLHGDEMELDSNDENEEPQETVDASELQEQLRLAARSKGKEKRQFNPEDVEWMHGSTWSDEDNDDVKDVEVPRKKPIALRRPAVGRELGDLGFPDRPASGTWGIRQMEQLEAWHKEQGNRTVNTAGHRGSNAVTGHGNKSIVSKSSRSHISRQEQSSGRHKLAKTTSILASVTDKQSRFGS